MAPLEDFWRSHWLLISLPYGPHSGYYLHRKESHQQTHCLHYQGKIKEISLCILNIKMWKEVTFIWGLAAVNWQWWPVGRMTLQDLIWLQPVSEKVSVVLKCENVVSFIIYWATSQTKHTQYYSCMIHMWVNIQQIKHSNVLNSELTVEWFFPTANQGLPLSTCGQFPCCCFPIPNLAHMSWSTYGLFPTAQPWSTPCHFLLVVVVLVVTSNREKTCRRGYEHFIFYFFPMTKPWSTHCLFPSSCSYFLPRSNGVWRWPVVVGQNNVYACFSLIIL